MPKFYFFFIYEKTRNSSFELPFLIDRTNIGYGKDCSTLILVQCSCRAVARRWGERVSSSVWHKAFSCNPTNVSEPACTLKRSIRGAIDRRRISALARKQSGRDLSGTLGAAGRQIDGKSRELICLTASKVLLPDVCVGQRSNARVQQTKQGRTCAPQSAVFATETPGISHSAWA